MEDSDKEGLRTLPFSLSPRHRWWHCLRLRLMLPDLTATVARLSTGRTYRYVDQKPRHTDKHGTTLLCLHGFPDLSYGWRHQIRPWAAQGYRVIAPDMLGYGKTDMPLEASAYSTKRLCDDLAALLDHLGVQKAVSTILTVFSSNILSSAQVVIGHDWGSFIAGRFALWYPQRLLALALYAHHSINMGTAEPADVDCPYHIHHPRFITCPCMKWFSVSHPLVTNFILLLSNLPLRSRPT